MNAGAGGGAACGTNENPSNVIDLLLVNTGIIVPLKRPIESRSGGELCIANTSRRRTSAPFEKNANKKICPFFCPDKAIVC